MTYTRYVAKPGGYDAITGGLQAIKDIHATKPGKSEATYGHGAAAGRYKTVQYPHAARTGVSGAIYSTNPNLPHADAMLYFHDMISAKQGDTVVSMRPNVIHKSDSRANAKEHCYPRYRETIDTAFAAMMGSAATHLAYQRDNNSERRCHSFCSKPL